MTNRARLLLLVLTGFLSACCLFQRDKKYCEYLVKGVTADRDCECPAEVDKRICMKQPCENATECRGLVNPMLTLPCTNNPRKTCTIFVDNSVDPRRKPKEIECKVCPPVD